MSSSSPWKLVLLVDCKELSKSKKHDLGKFIENINQDLVEAGCGTPCSAELGNERRERKALPVGDYMVVARPNDEFKIGESSESSQLLDERVLSIVERKTVPDLAGALKHSTKSAATSPLTRMETQMWRMKHCCSGSSEVEKILLVEGNIFKCGNPYVKHTDKKRVWSFTQEVPAMEGFRLVATTTTEKTRQYLVQHLMAVEQRHCGSLHNFANQHPTFDTLARLCKHTFQDPQFRFYVALRKVKSVGDVKAMALLQTFRSPRRLQMEIEKSNGKVQHLLKAAKAEGLRSVSRETLRNVMKYFCSPAGSDADGEESAPPPTPFESPHLCTAKRRRATAAPVSPSPAKKARAT